MKAEESNRDLAPDPSVIEHVEKTLTRGGEADIDAVGGVEAGAPFGSLVRTLLDDVSSAPARAALDRWRAAHAPEAEDAPESWEGLLTRHSMAEVMFCVETAHGILSRLALLREADERGVTSKCFSHPLQRRVNSDDPQTGEYLTDLADAFKDLADAVAGNLYPFETFDWWREVDSADTSLAVGRVWLVVGRANDAVGGGDDPLGDLYRELFGRRARRTHGEFYTPPEAVSFTLDRASCTPTRGESVIDPACGSGAFLVDALERSVESAEVRADAVEALFVNRELVGLDIRPFAVLLARVRVVAAGLRWWPSGGVDSIPIHCTDTLTSHRADTSSLGDASQLTLEATGDRVTLEVPSGESITLSEDTAGRYDRVIDVVADESHAVTEAALAHALKHRDYDYVVGNPPYVNIKNVAESRKVEYKQNYQTAHYRFDLYVLFVERGLDLLCDGGSLSFVIPNKFTRSQYGEKLRDLLASSYDVDTYAEIGNVFDDATTFACVLTVHRAEPSGRVDYAKALGGGSPSFDRLRDGLADGGEVIDEHVEASSYPQSSLGTDVWNFVPQRAREVAEKVRSVSSTTVADVALGVRNGVSSGADEVYVLSEQEVNSLDIDKDLVRPLVRGRDVRRWTVDWSGDYALFPYDESGHVDLDQYPRAREYIDDQRETLEDRYCTDEGDKSIYEYDGARTRSVFEGDFRIAVPDIATENHFSHPNGFRCFKNTAYVLTFPEDQPYSQNMLLGALNSTPVEFLLKQSSPPLQGDQQRFRYKTDYVAPLPLPEPDSELDSLVEDALSADGDEEQRRAEDEIDDRVCELFALDPDDRQVIRRYLDAN